MAIFVIDTSSGEKLEAEIIGVSHDELPGNKESWYFDWRNLDLTHASVYKLCLSGDKEIHGLVAFEIISEMSVMKYLEVAPFNYGKKGRYDRVAGCLIAKCCRLAYTEPSEPIWMGYLTFTPISETVGRIYQIKYGATGGPTGLMSIGREQSKQLIDQYL